MQSCFDLFTRNKKWLRAFGLEIILIRLYNMTSLEKAINLGDLFLIFKPEKNPSINAPLSSACFVMFQFIEKSVFEPNICTLNWAQITGTVDVH